MDISVRKDKPRHILRSNLSGFPTNLGQNQPWINASYHVYIWSLQTAADDFDPAKYSPHESVSGLEWLYEKKLPIP